MTVNRLVLKEEQCLYAQTLLDAAFEQGGIEGVLDLRKDLLLVCMQLSENYDLKTSLEDPSISADARAKLAEAVFQGAHAVLQGVLMTMTYRSELGFLHSVAYRFDELLHEKHNLVVVEVTTGIELDAHLREIIKQKLAQDLACGIALHEKLDPRILGGIILSAQGKTIDASCATQLERARRVLRMKVDGGECS